MSITIAENHPGSGPALVAILTRAGYKTTLARSYETALASIRHDRPNILVTDRQFPDGDGWDLIRAAKAIDPTVFCVGTTGAAGDAEAGAIEAGADAFLGKPIDLERMLAILPPPLASTQGA